MAKFQRDGGEIRGIMSKSRKPNIFDDSEIYVKTIFLQNFGWGFKKLQKLQNVALKINATQSVYYNNHL